MKSLKLVIVFVVILGGIVGALFLINPHPPIPHSLPTTSDLKQARQKFEDDWKQANDWNEDIFIRHCAILDQLSTEYNVSELRDLNTSLAVEIINKKIFEEWKSPSCRKSIIDNYNNAITTIEGRDREASTKPKVKKIKDVYATYKAAYDLANKPIGFSPHFNGNNWNSYKNYANSVKAQLTSMLNNNNYKAYLSNIVDIKNGLNSIPSKLDSKRSDFYATLANQIVAYFGKISRESRSKADLNKLRHIITTYNKEFGKSKILSDFDEEFSYDADNNDNNYYY